MSTGMFHVLPLVRGWEWLPFIQYEQTLDRGKDMEFEFRGTGWLLGITFVSTDEKAKFEVRTRSGKASMKLILEASIESHKYAFNNASDGYASVYMKTNATSTAGFYKIYPYSGWGNASLLPFLDRTRIKLMLGADSTQENAYMLWAAGIINIINISLFVRSLREIMGTRNMNIDSTLIEFAEQYPEEK